ncbi:MAG: rhodanese-like domain-containing protein [Deltaproteobacteria bacterium]|nr:rhodanese-like domain-containing protein [Deltaproteobacteria bacterium]
MTGRRWPKRLGAGFAILMSVVMIAAWKPLASQRTRSRAEKADAALKSRSIHVSAAELATLMRDRDVALAILDLRSEAAFNRFHLLDAHRFVLDDRSIEGLARQGRKKQVIMLIGDDPTTPDAVARTLMVRGLPNVYVLDGGIGSWLSLFSALPGGPLEAGALGARQPASAPDITLVQLPEFEKKVKLAAQGKKKSGGCGG